MTFWGIPKYFSLSRPPIFFKNKITPKQKGEYNRITEIQVTNLVPELYQSQDQLKPDTIIKSKLPRLPGIIDIIPIVIAIIKRELHHNW